MVAFAADRAEQVHADAAIFDPDVSKSEAYRQVMEQAAALFEGQRNWVAQSYMLDYSVGL